MDFVLEFFARCLLKDLSGILFKRFLIIFIALNYYILFVNIIDMLGTMKTKKYLNCWITMELIRKRRISQ